MKRFLIAMILLSPSISYGASIDSNIKTGSTGQDVVVLQNFLIANGYLQGLPTGTFGPLTKKAVIVYQKQAGILPLTGNVGPLTRKAINLSISLQEKNKSGGDSNSDELNRLKKQVNDLVSRQANQFQPSTPISTTTQVKFGDVISRGSSAKISYVVLSDGSLTIHSNFPIDIHDMRFIVHDHYARATTTVNILPDMNKTIADKPGAEYSYVIIFQRKLSDLFEKSGLISPSFQLRLQNTEGVATSSKTFSFSGDVVGDLAPNFNIVDVKQAVIPIHF